MFYMGFPDNHILVETISIEQKDRVESLLNSERSSLNVLKAISNSEATTKQQTIDRFIKRKKCRFPRYTTCDVIINNQ